MEENNRKGPGIFYAVVGVATLVVAIVGATFAYFTAQATVTGNENITGTTAQASNASVTVARVYPEAGKIETERMVPLLSDRIATAVDAANNCVDSNGYVACQVYSVTVKNNAADTIYVNTNLQLTVKDIENMQWAVMTDQNTYNEDAAIVEDGTLGTVATGTELTGNAEKIFYVLVWLNDTGAPQETTDAGRTFTGAVTASFVSANGDNIANLTATFTGTGA